MADDRRSEALWSDEYLSFTPGTLLKASSGDMMFLVVGTRHVSHSMLRLHVLYSDVWGEMKLSIGDVNSVDLCRCRLVSRP
jgi:hypothetical protein